MSPEDNTSADTSAVDQTTDTTTPAKDDPYKQIKGEMNRKFSDQSKLLEQLTNTNAQLAQKLDALVNPRPAPQKEEPLERLMYSDPKAYTQRVKEQARNEALDTMRAESQGQGAINAKISALAAEYPELADANSELTKASVELLKAANNVEKQNPTTYEYAVLKAAQQLDVKPKSKRPKQEDDFVGPTYTSPQSRGKRKSEEAVIREGKDSAKAFGIDLDNPKTKDKYIKLLKAKGLV